MGKPLISIIVPCYNVEQYIDQTINCVISQTYDNWELILVDDGSKDRTPSICDDYAKKDGRIRVIHKANGGLVSARNAGYEVVKGEWHMYLDGDDWIDVNTCQELVDYISEIADVDVVFWKCIQELNDKSIIGKWEWHCKEKRRLYIGDECKELSRNVLVYKSGIATAYCKLINTQFARSNKLCHDSRLRQGAEGTEFSLRVFYYSKSSLFVNEYYNHYRYNPNSISKQVDEKNTKYLTDCFEVINNDIVNTFVLDDNERGLFIRSLYERIVYMLIAIAMSTYFHPANSESYSMRKKKYNEVVFSNGIYRSAVELAECSNLDKTRKIAAMGIKHKQYWLLEAIAWTKTIMFKLGYFNY